MEPPYLLNFSLFWAPDFECISDSWPAEQLLFASTMPSFRLVGAFSSTTHPTLRRDPTGSLHAIAGIDLLYPPLLFINRYWFTFGVILSTGYGVSFGLIWGHGAGRWGTTDTVQLIPQGCVSLQLWDWFIISQRYMRRQKRSLFAVYCTMTGL